MGNYLPSFPFVRCDIDSVYRCLCINNEYAYLYRIQSINIMATAIDLSWFYQGVERFQKITIRNMLVKAIYM